MDFFTQNGGPLALQAIDGLKEDSGAYIEFNDQAWTRGMIVQIGEPSLAEVTGDFQSIDGMFGHGGVISTGADADNGFYGVATSVTTAEDTDGAVFVKGFVYANVWVEATETLTQGQVLYAAEGETVLVTSVNGDISTVASDTTRAVATCLETVADPANNAVRLTRVLFNGIPAHLG